jgi:hypothetical protein
MDEDFEDACDPQSVPVHVLNESPSLILKARPDRYPPAPFHLDWVLNTDETQIALDPIQMNVVFPSMPIPFTMREQDTFSGSDILNRCVEVFHCECSNPTLRHHGTVVDLNRKAKDLITKGMIESFTFNCTVADSQMKKINQRVFNCAQIISTEESYRRSETDATETDADEALCSKCGR